MATRATGQIRAKCASPQPAGVACVCALYASAVSRPKRVSQTTISDNCIRQQSPDLTTGAADLCKVHSRTVTCRRLHSGRRDDHQLWRVQALRSDELKSLSTHLKNAICPIASTYEACLLDLVSQSPETSSAWPTLRTLQISEASMQDVTKPAFRPPARQSRGAGRKGIAKDVWDDIES